MASVSPLKDIEDKYFECSYCLEHFKEPMLLPCVHRYCRNCLEKVIGQRVKAFNCPLCDYLCAIPPGGVDGFRTDFHMKSMLQYIQLQHSATKEEIKECAGCSKTAKITAYCFKCKGFLCDQCHQLHTTLKMMAEHRPSLLHLKEIRDQKLTLERLAALTESPRCSVHVDKLAEVCCGTCHNLPVYMVCAQYGKHRRHEIHDVELLAQQERKRIEASLNKMEEHGGNVYGLPRRIEATKTKLKDTIAAKKARVQSEYNMKMEKIARRLKEIETDSETNLKEIDDIEEQEVMELEEARKEEIQMAVKTLNLKYDRLITKRKTTYRSIRDCQEHLWDMKKAETISKREKIDEQNNKMTRSIDSEGERNFEQLDKVSNECKNRIMRFENFRSTVSCILASDDKWTDVQCLPDIGFASGPLIKDVAKDFPELESLADITSNDRSMDDTAIISAQIRSVIGIEGIKANGWTICNMTTNGNGDIVITGDIDKEQTHITVITREGIVVNQEKRWNTLVNEDVDHGRSCSALTLSKVATTCRNGEIGIYNIYTGKYSGKDIPINILQMKDFVTCVATDCRNKTIYVGSSTSNIFVFDDKLDFCRILELPGMNSYPFDMTFNDGKLFVCDACEKAYAVETGGQKAKVIHKFRSPRKAVDHMPMGICTGSNDHTYILWKAVIPNGEIRDILAQYSQEGNLLTTVLVDGDAAAITVLDTENGEELLLSTYRSGKVYIYGIKQQ